MKNDKIVIERVPSYRYRGIGTAAKKLGVSVTAVHLFLGGRVKTLSASKRARIVVRDVKARGEGEQRNLNPLNSLNPLNH